MKNKMEQLMIAIISVLLTALLGAAWILLDHLSVMRADIDSNKNAVKEIIELKKTMISIDKGVAVLVEKSNTWILSSLEIRAKQDDIFGTQKLRTTTIKRAEKHMGNAKIHRYFR